MYGGIWGGPEPGASGISVGLVSDYRRITENTECTVGFGGSGTGGVGD